jgi:replication factor C subunit 3/5
MIQSANKKTSLPFVEKFRPKKLDDILYHDDIIKTLKIFIDKKVYNIQHLLFYGPPGTGKTSTIEAFLNELYGEHVDEMTMNINASEERGIEVVRKKIIPFVSTIPVANINNDIPKYKFIILDEADAMTLDAQAMMRQVIENHTYNARFCLICNCIKRINEAIQSRCTIFKFSPLDYPSVKKKIKMITDKINVNVTNSGIKTIWKLSDGDMRKVMHFLQIISINNKKISSNTITTFLKYPTESESKKIYNYLVDKKLDLVGTIQKVKDIIGNTYSLSDVIKELTLIIVENTINKKIEPLFSREIIKLLADLEMNLISTTNSNIQFYNLVSAFILLKNKN